jgi:integrase
MAKRVPDLAELSAEAQQLYRDTRRELGVREAAGLSLLLSAARSLDRLRQAEAVLAREGGVYMDRFGQPKLHQIQSVKSLKGNRTCEISPQLVQHLRAYLRSWRPNKLDLLFATENGTPWDADVVRKRKLYPLLEQLGIERCGFHAFRHGNETLMDAENVPMATRQNRLGHSDAKTTMKYTHVISEDGRKIAARFGELLTPSALPTMPVGNA